MANISLKSKQLAITSAWSFFINSATGDYPNVTYVGDETFIDFKPGQAEKFNEYLESSLFDNKTESLGVHVNLKPVITPLALKHGTIPALGYSAALMILTKIFWK